MRVPEPGETLGRYRLDRVIGQGGMAVVFAATDPRLDRTVAVKVITGAHAGSAEFRQRFHAEAAALASLDSPYVTTIHDHDEVDGVLFIVMQYVDGTDLASLLRTGGPLQPRDALLLAAHLSRGLGDAHRRGIVHRDVKPGNVLLRDPGTAEAHAYLSDFGVARAARADEQQLTAPGTVTGTWAYLAPEVLRGEPATPASDLYALGCVLWACLTAEVPYPGTDPEAALAHVNDPIPQLEGDDELTLRLNGLFTRLLAKDPADRPADTAELRQELEQLASAAGDRPALVDAPTTAPSTVRRAAPATPTPRAGTGFTRSRRRLLVVAGIALLALIGGGIAWATVAGDGSAEPDEPEPAPVAGDLDGDGDGDLLVHQVRAESFSTVGLWEIGSTGRAFGSGERVPGGERRPTIGDVDGDGGPDLLWLDTVTLDDRIAVTVTPAAGESWTAEIDLDPALFGSLPQTTVGDVTGDGRDDVVILGRPQDGVGGVHVAAATDRGFEPTAQWYAVPADADRTDSLFAADVDGDGRDEALLVSIGDDDRERLQVLRADDDGFEAGEPRRVGGPEVSLYLSTWLIGDVDGDDADELVIPQSICRSVDVYSFDDDGLADPESWWQRDLTEKQARACFGDYQGGHWTLSDVDGDGDDDLVELRPTDQDRFDIVAYAAEHDRFAAPAPWGTFDCGDECEDTFNLLDP